MKIEGKVAVGTGGASGIGRELCRRFAALGAKGVVVCDISADGAAAVADEIGGTAVVCDLGSEDECKRHVDEANAAYGQVDLLCSNAAIASAPDQGMI